ncbi:MAG: chloride channel protein [Hyphomicrobiales bacterium]|nr:chloride channel protein [Hyphomicrobiales bacterium]MCP5373376.1 chloride channel protein [Hyphomicrobiales bacterium]
MAKNWFKASRLLMRLRKVVGNDQLVLSALAVVVGAGSGAGVIAFREAIGLIQHLAYGTGDDILYLHLLDLPWWRVLLPPAIGGLAVGLLVHFAMPGRRPQGVADVIEASALRSGRLPPKAGVGAALVSAASIGVGASVGREGPAVHLGAAIGSWISARLRLTRSLSRALLGCGTAAAVAASFNAPIAGALFANEVIVGHYALSAFAPIVIASVTGTVVSRAYYGDFPAFHVYEHQIASVLEFPAFIGLGVLCGVLAILLLRSIFLVQDLSRRIPVPGWARPAGAGFLVGAIGVFLPQVMGVGYGITNLALNASVPLTMLLVLIVAKVAATAISLGGGFGGGIFSPSLVVGALTGAAYGTLATQAFPELSSGPGAYTLVGMGAMAAATLGAPISTTLIIFELTGDYALTVAVMIAVVIASVVTQQAGLKSFFTRQLLRRGIDLDEGYESTLLRAGKIRDVVATDAPRVTPDVTLAALREGLQHSTLGELFVVGADDRLIGTITLADLSEAAFDHDMDDLVCAADVARLHPPMLSLDDHLETALTLMRDSGEEHIAVVDGPNSLHFVGCVHETEVMAAYNRALLESRREEHY